MNTTANDVTYIHIHEAKNDEQLFTCAILKSAERQNKFCSSKHRESYEAMVVQRVLKLRKFGENEFSVRDFLNQTDVFLVKTIHGNDDKQLVTHLSLVSFLWDIGKQYSPRCDAAKSGVPSGAILFAQRNFIEESDEK